MGFSEIVNVRSVVAVILSVLLPGTGLVYLGWLWTGLWLGLACVAALDTALVGWFVAPGTLPAWAVWAAAGTAAALWMTAIGLTVFVALRRQPARTAAERDRLFREAMDAYLKNDLDGAQRLLRRILALSRRDVEAHLRLAMVYKALGRHRQAAAELRLCRYYDDAETWRWEVARELAALAEQEQVE